MVGINKPTGHEDKSIFKAIRVQLDDSLEIHNFYLFLGSLYHTPKVLHLIVSVVCVKAHSVIDYTASTEQDHFRVRL